MNPNSMKHIICNQLYSMRLLHITKRNVVLLLCKQKKGEDKEGKELQG
jgi:hypothetical protein